MSIKKFIFNLLFLLLFLRIITGYSTKNNIQKPDNLITKKIQKSIDSCFAIGGGIVKLQKGIHISGSLILKSNVKLFLEKGAILQGSSDDRDYQNDVLFMQKMLKILLLKVKELLIELIVTIQMEKKSPEDLIALNL